MAKKRTKTDFSEQLERQKQFRAYLARKEEEMRQRKERETAEQKRS
jgi:ribosomal protein L35